METNGTILYVDDEKINLLVFEKLMGRKYTVITANDGVEGLAVLDSEPAITCVFSDMRMPIMSGLEFIRKAKARFGDKRYFILTGYSVNDEIQQALDDKLIIKCFTKPADFAEIDRVLQSGV